MARNKHRKPEPAEKKEIGAVDKWDGSPMGGFMHRPPEWCFGRLTVAHGSTWVCTMYCGRCSDRLECPAYQKREKEKEVTGNV